MAAFVNHNSYHGVLPIYQYTLLTDDPSQPERNKNFRLIHLKPALTESADLNCVLEIVNADKAPEYEALSWCWGTEPHDQCLTISTIGSDNSESVSALYIPETLAKALKTLRRRKKSRTLWVDLISINQENKKERNKQVPMMGKIYGNATNVCIWLDDSDVLDLDVSVPKKRKRHHRHTADSSSDEEGKRSELIRKREKKAALQALAMEQDKKAIKFIQHHVLGLWQFDELCKTKARAEDWAALVSLMRKPWFSRRWVVQEIALAKKATLYAGNTHIPWRDFVDAVSLFVEVEDATRRLTEIMQQHEVYNHVPDFFEDLSEIGASMLIKATSNLYRGKEEDGKRDSQRTLEYLISALPVFDVTDPRDAVYALLAISKDSTPLAANQEWNLKLFQRIIQNNLDHGLTKKTFRVDYGMNIVDVFQEFVAFSIRRSMDTDPERALDILCRPWAPNPRESLRIQEHNTPESRRTKNEKLPSWMIGTDQAAFKILDHPTFGRRMGRSNADPLVGLPDENRFYRAAESKGVDRETFKFKKCNKFYSIFVKGFQLDTVGKKETCSQNGQIPWDWIEAANWTDTDNETPPEEFWRTLVADRGQYGRNAPPFFERACHESVKRERKGETVDVKKLITEGRCSIITTFLRRVQAVIWNRCLARCVQSNRLCVTPKATLSGDLICILYGCSVPVILRPQWKSDADLADEILCDEIEKNKPRENAARKILQAYRKHSNKRERDGSKPDSRYGTPIKSPPLEGVLDGAKQSRWEREHEEVDQIVENEKMDLQQKIKDAQAAPSHDQSRQFFKFIGPCYVHGMMNGEAIEEQNNKGLKSQVFELH